MAWQRVDDLNGDLGADQITFGYAGVGYVIDLCPANVSTLENFLRPFIEASHAYCQLPQPHTGPTDVIDGELHTRELRPERARGEDHDAQLPPERVIRAWAITHGFDVGPKGRLPRSVIEAYVRGLSDPR